MKTTVWKYVKFLALGILMLNLTACEVEIDDLDEVEVEHVCVGPTYELTKCTWVSHYTDIDGNYCTQEWRFYANRRGVDFILVQYPDGAYKTMEYEFDWDWDNRAQTSLYMNYGKGDVSYLDRVYVRGSKLSGYLDGRDNYVEFFRK